MTRKRVPLLVAVLAALSFCGLSREESRKDQALSLCEVVDDSAKYHEQTVRVHAVFAVGPETGWLYDPDCQGGRGLTDVEIRNDATGAIEELDRLIEKEKRASVVLEGVFYGPEVFRNVDPRLPPGIRKRLEKSRRRYGHMDAFPTMIDVTRVIEAGRAADRQPPE